jgi:hypothetical protein
MPPLARGRGGTLPPGGIRYFRKWLFDTTVAEVDWSRGLVRDIPRSEIPPGGAYNLVDFFCDRPGMLYKRGGTAFQGGVLNAHSDNDVIGTACPQFAGDPRVCAFTSDGTNTWLYDVTDPGGTGTAVSVGNIGFAAFENPTFFDEKLIVTDGLGNKPPTKVYLTGSPPPVGAAMAFATLGGLPPVGARYSCVHSGRLLLAGSPKYPNRIWAGPPLSDAESAEKDPILAVSTSAKTFTVALTPVNDPSVRGGNLYTLGFRFSVWGSTGNNGRYTVAADPTKSGANLVIPVVETIPSAVVDGTLGDGWDTDHNFTEVNHPITGIVSVGSGLLVFSRQGCQRIIGTQPPSAQDTTSSTSSTSYWSLQPFGEVGCIDARSIVQMSEMVYFADEGGLWVTDGVHFTSLTTKKDSSGIGSFWRTLIQGFSPTEGTVVCCGAYLDRYLLVAVTHNSGARYQFLYYTPHASWTQLSVKAGAFMYASRFAPTIEIYAGCSDPAAPVRLLKLSGMWDPSQANMNDADGTPVTPLYESRTLTNSTGLKRYGFGHLTYQMSDPVSANPQLQVAVATGILHESGFTAAPESPFLATQIVNRKRLTLYRDAQGLALQLSQVNPSAFTEIFVAEVEIGMFYQADGPTDADA